MLFGAPLLASCFAALWFPPNPGKNTPENVVYFCFVFAGFNIMNSFVTSPYTALLAEVLIFFFFFVFFLLVFK